MSSAGGDLEKLIAGALAASGLKYQRNVAVGHTTSDFYVLTPSGSSLVFEVKTWQPTPSNQERATNLASLYKSASGADDAFVVMPGLTKNQPEKGLVSAEKFTGFLTEYVATIPRSSHPTQPQVRPIPDKSIFVAMPFAPKYDDTFLVAMQPAALDLQADCVRVDYTQFTGDIVAEIKRLIRKSTAAIADLSDSRPNVLYEMGLAEAQGLSVIQICSSDLKELPFDVRNNKTIEYSIGQVSKLRPKIHNALSAVIK